MPRPDLGKVYTFLFHDLIGFVHITRTAASLTANIIGKLALVVASWAVLANNVISVSLARTAVTLFPSTAHALCILPHNLGKMRSSSRVSGFVIIVLLALTTPHVGELSPKRVAGPVSKIFSSALPALVSVEQ